MTIGQSLLTANSLYRFYRAGDEEILALQGISFSVSAGELLVIAGPSGSGKSTLLGCLAGLDEPDGGAVWLNSERLSHRDELTRTRMRRRYLGLMYQSGNLIDHLTVDQNIRLAQHLARRAGRASVDDLLGSVHLLHRSGHYARQLSGGETARAALAVALANDPLIMLADEPTGELDESNEDRIFELLLQRAASGKAVVLVSHAAAARRIADRVIDLSDGRIAS